MKGFQSYILNTERERERQTDRHDPKHYLPAYAGDKNTIIYSVTMVTLTPVRGLGKQRCDSEELSYFISRSWFLSRLHSFQTNKSVE